MNKNIIGIIIVIIMATLTIDLRNLHAVTNDKYYQLYVDKSPELLLYGGASSGKSIFASDKHIFRIITEHNHNFLFLRKVARTCRHSVFVEAQKSAEKFGLIKDKDYFVNKSDMTLSFPMFNSTILCMGMDDSEKIKSISGITGIWFEEVTEAIKDDLEQLSLRMRGLCKNYKQRIYTCNPVNIGHHVKTELIDKPNNFLKCIHSTYKDNRFLTADDVRIIESKTGYHRDVYTLGLWGVIGKLVFPNYEIKEINQDPFQYDEATFGTDFGFTHASVKLLVGRKDGDIYVLKECWAEGLTNAEFIVECNDRFDIEDKEQIADYGDSAEPDRIKEFKQSGWRMKPVLKYAGSVRSAIDYIKDCKIYIHPSCVRTISEIQQYQHHKDKNGIYSEEPIAVYDDAMAALRYSIDKHKKKRRESKDRMNENKIKRESKYALINS